MKNKLAENMIRFRTKNLDNQLVRLKSLKESRAARENQGLMVTGSTQLDNNKIGDLLDGLGLHAEWSAQHGHWFFPEDEESYANLEALLDAEFGQHGINARFEGI
jgi:hypothetical protein